MTQAHIGEVGYVWLEEALHYCGLDEIVGPNDLTDFVVL